MTEEEIRIDERIRIAKELEEWMANAPKHGKLARVEEAISLLEAGKSIG